MSRTFSLVCCSVIVLGSGILAFQAHTGEAVHWGYSGKAGPDHWGELSSEFALCANGRNQSPIDIVDPVASKLPAADAQYRGRTTQVVNNGHTIQVEVEPGSAFLAEGKTFDLVQFHFHSPSENRVRGEKFPLEAHFVHRSASGELAVLAVLFRQGAANATLASIWSRLPAKADEHVPLALALQETDVLPADRSYYRYSGSLTTPPCSEGVSWFVLKAVKSVSPGQVSAFVRVVGENARGPQPLFARQVRQ